MLSQCIFVLVVVWVSLFPVIGYVETQQQTGIVHTTATLSEARSHLAATSSGDLAFFGGGNGTTGLSARVDILNVSSGIWTTTNLSQPRGWFAAISSRNLVFFGGGGTYIHIFRSS